MPGKAASPRQIADVIALREAGFTVAAVAARSKLSVSTVNRIIGVHGAKKGAATEQAVDEARQKLRALLWSKEAIADEAAQMIADDIAQARLLRERLLNAAGHLNATNLREAAVMMRAAAAFSTALKNTSDMVRHSFGYEKRRDEPDEEDLPILQVQELPDETVRELRDRSRLAEKDGDDSATHDETVLAKS